MMGKYRCYLFGIIFATALAVIFPAAAQTTIAISDFSNRSDKFYLDTWETKIPEFLKSELSRSPQLVLVERNHIKAVLDEQALSLSGLIDTSTVQEFGKLAGAEYVITGTIHEDGSRIRIDHWIGGSDRLPGRVPGGAGRSSRNALLPGQLPGSHCAAVWLAGVERGDPTQPQYKG